MALLSSIAQEDIIADYQVSYTYNANGINRIVQNIPQLKAYLEQAGEDSVLHSHPKNIQAVLGLLNTDTVGAWLEHAGVSAGLQQSFCDHMLEPAE